MILERLSVLNYKNLEQVDLELSPKLNCFLGNNGMGKTNLLDAIFYLSFCKSYSNPIDSQNIKHDADFAVIQGWYQLDNKQEEFFCSLRRRQKKQFKRNKKEYERLSEHIGLLPLVMVSPSDTGIISGGSDERRKFVDIVLSQFDKEYLNALIKYNKALQQRNALLKTEHVDDALLDLWDEQLAQEGTQIYDKRKKFVDSFIPTFQKFYAHICSSAEKVELKYESDFDKGDFLTLLNRQRNKDKLLGHTTVGIHKDDLDMLMDGYSIKRIGSQGQNKTFVVALKLAQFSFLHQEGTTTPILLLDDIFDKLDSSRVEQIVKLVLNDASFGQIFITDTNREHLDEILKHTEGSYTLYQVIDGSVILKTEK